MRLSGAGKANFIRNSEYSPFRRPFPEFTDLLSSCTPHRLYICDNVTEKHLENHNTKIQQFACCVQSFTDLFFFIVVWSMQEMLYWLQGIKSLQYLKYHSVKLEQGSKRLESGRAADTQ